MKYETVAAHFGPDRLTPYQDDDGPGLRLGSPLSTEDLTIRDPRGGSPIDIAPIDMPLPARLALVPPGAVSQEFARVVAGLAMPRGGTVRIGHYDLATLPRSIFSSRLAFAGNTPVLFPGSIRDNLLYGLRVKPQASRRLDFTKQSLREALRTGNPLDSITDPWIDFAALGVEDAAGLDRRLVEILSRLGLGDDLYRYGLGTLSSVTHESEAGQRFILAREHLREHFEQQGLAGLVIPFSRGAFNDQATLGENLLFGVPRDTSLTEPLRLAAAVPFRTALAQTRLLDDLDRMGVEIARNLSEIFKDVPPGHPLFRRFSLITPEMVPEYEARLSRLAPTGRLPEEDSKAFLALSLAYVEPRMRFGLVDPILKSRVVGARSVVQDAFGGQDGCDIETYDPARINPRASVLDNILFGRIDTARMHSEEIIQREVLAVFREFDLEDGIRRRGLERQVGNRGLLLPERVRVRVGLTRALLRQPEILVIDRVTDHLEGGVQTLLDVVEEMIPSATLLASVSSEVEVHAFPDALRLVPSDQPMRNAAE
ncbi:hypothetical protein ACFQE0_12265 [Methylobacterium komagatae]|uniref:ABC transporter domain-containing protein n=1 Tax=Methylobacterium komagatae TaxID=374425 RepID=A0ABW2BIQ8_9HYPH